MKDFLNCKECTYVYGCFLNWGFRGQLAIAIAKDGNNQILPPCWELVQY